MQRVNPPADAPGLRARQKQATVDAILDSARLLFRESGFAGVTIRRIAEHAGVSPETIYQRFGTKAGVLDALIRRAVRTDSDRLGTSIPMLVEAMLHEPDLSAQIDRWAALSRQVNENAWDLFEVARAAAGSDPASAAHWSTEQQWRYEAQQRLAHSLASKAALRADMTETVAADLLWTWCGHDLYRLLTIERGWTPDAYQHRLIQTCRRVLLSEPPHCSPDPNSTGGGEAASGEPEPALTSGSARVTASSATGSQHAGSVDSAPTVEGRGRL